MNPGRNEGGPFHHNHSSHLGTSRIDGGGEDTRREGLIFDSDHPADVRFFTDLSIFRDDDEDDVSHTSSDAEIPPNQQTLFSSDPGPSAEPVISGNPNPYDPSSCNDGLGGKTRSLPRMYISPEAHLSSSFYTFNQESHFLMLQCLREGRLATAEEIRAVTPGSVLSSWRAVWKDRNEDTAYLTAWKRIQEKLSIHVNPMDGNEFLCFKTNYNQFISYVHQWQDIVMDFHCVDDYRHLGVKETVEAIKQTWTVGAKFYGIPESFIRTCVLACPICSDESSGCAPRNKRRRFEYTESFEVPAKDVPTKLQQLATKHKVVLCIRQKYIRYKPFMAEVKDYACHRAGDPASSKKPKNLKRENYASKRCGCGFRIRAIVPISNYSEKEKTFIYEEEGTAVFKLYAKHTGHEPGLRDGNARIMHRIVGHKGVMMEQDGFYGMSEEAEIERFGSLGKNEDLQHSVLHQLHELKNELELLEGKIGKIPPELLSSVSRDLFHILHKLRNVGECGSKTMELLQDKHDPDGVLVGENDVVEWAEHQHSRLYGDGKDVELLDDDDDSFGRTLGDVVPWEQIRTGSRNEKDLLSDSCKAEKWLSSGDFDEKSMLDSGDSKMTKRLRHDETLDPESGLVGIQVDNFYPENPKWFDSPCGLDSGADCGDSEFRHGGLV